MKGLRERLRNEHLVEQIEHMNEIDDGEMKILREVRYSSCARFLFLFLFFGMPT
jgi:hypothetical protein